MARLSTSLLALVFAVSVALSFAPNAKPGIELADRLMPPTFRHPLGTDSLGRDLMRAIIFGMHISIGSAIVAVLTAAIVGLLVTAVVTVLPRTRLVVTSLIDGFLAIPPLLLPVAIAVTVGGSPISNALAIGFSWWPWYARLARSEVAIVLKSEFVHAAVALGATRLRVVLSHAMPNCLAAVFAQSTLDVPYAVLTSAALTFVGAGTDEASLDWGTLILNGRPYQIPFWWTVAGPGLALVVTTYFLARFAENVQDRLGKGDRAPSKIFG
jgi:peptide/nickel transport system permease protein